MLNNKADTLLTNWQTKIKYCKINTGENMENLIDLVFHQDLNLLHMSYLHWYLLLEIPMICFYLTKKYKEKAYEMLSAFDERYMSLKQIHSAEDTCKSEQSCVDYIKIYLFC